MFSDALGKTGMTAKPRLLIVGGFPPSGSKIIGGIVTSCRRLMLSSFVDRFNIATVDSTQISNPPPMLARRIIGATTRFLTFLNQLRRHKPDAVLLFCSGGASLIEKGAMAWVCHMFGVPALLFPRAGAVIDSYEASRIWQRFIRLSFGGAAMILCQGSRWQDFVIQKLGRDSKEAPILTNWTASEDLLAVGRSRTMPAPDAPSRIIFLGWLEQSKGIFELIEALNPLAERLDFTLSIAGDGHARQDAEVQIRAGPLAHRTRFLGWVRPALVPATLADHDILVLPSWAEGLPNAMIEGMAAGLGVIVTSVGDVPDFLEDGKNGLMIPPQNIAALKLALARLIPSPDLQYSLGMAAHSLACERFSVETAAAELTDILQKLLKYDDTALAGC